MELGHVFYGGSGFKNDYQLDIGKQNFNVNGIQYVTAFYSTGFECIVNEQ